MLKLAGVAVLDEAGRILMLHRNTPKRVQWETPGGKVEDGETAEACALREFAEELKAKIEIVRRIGDAEFKEDGNTMHYTWFEARIVDGNPTINESKFDKFAYLLPEEMDGMPDISPNTRNLINSIKSGAITFAR